MSFRVGSLSSELEDSLLSACSLRFASLILDSRSRFFLVQPQNEGVIMFDYHFSKYRCFVDRFLDSLSNILTICEDFFLKKKKNGNSNTGTHFVQIVLFLNPKMLDEKPKACF